ncbi:MAG: FAD:protein FMN transferase [Rhodopirellula sp.]|nr:FAD:protein FMN transferase [Rhodopirellula sp.]
MISISRRRFWRVTLGAGGLLGLGAAAKRAWLSEHVDDRAARAAEPHEHTSTSSIFGAPISITAVHGDPALAGRAVEAALGELRRVERIMSLYCPESQLSRLNRNGVLHAPHPWLVEVLQQSQTLAQQSGGAFDMTVQPLWHVYRDAQLAASTAADRDVEIALRKVDWRRVEVSPEIVRLQSGGTQLTLNGIAQGFAADRAAAVLRAHGVRDAMIDAGEIAALGCRSDESQWKVGIQHPRERQAYAAVAGLSGRCLSTSGDYATSFSSDHCQNHLLDPRTGKSPSWFSSVSVVAPTAVRADGLSTALSVMGLEEGLKLLQKTANTDALFIFKDGRELATAGFPRCA